MDRKLSAIEIAEGALLADITVVCHLLSIYLPALKGPFYTLNFLVFTLLVLRRGFYVALLGMCVAVFLSFIVTGPHGMTSILIEGIGGLFLGFTMKHRFRHVYVLLIGITGGALTLFIFLLLTTLLVGAPLESIVLSLQWAYSIGMNVIGTVTASFGVGTWWQHSAAPFVETNVAVAFKYWLLLFYVIIWVIVCPIVTATYAAINALVRLLGYDVRPFPDGFIHRVLERTRRRIVRRRIRRRNKMTQRQEAGA